MADQTGGAVMNMEMTDSAHLVARFVVDDIIIVVTIIRIIGMPHICGMDTYGMKIMPQMSGIATFQDIYGMLIFEDEHAIDV